MSLPAGTTVINGFAVSPDGALYVTPTGTASITGGTESNVTYTNPTFNGIQVGNTYPVNAGGIPLIALSSGSVSAGGVISAITALPQIFPDAYCYFPVNILAGAIAAGWYYCTFSSTTAGIAFLNTYSSGTPTIPASPTAVTAGQGAFTGDLSTVVAHSFNIAASAMGKWGAIRINGLIQHTNSAGAKTMSWRLGGSGGFIAGVVSGANLAFSGLKGAIINTGSEGKQISAFEQYWANPTTISALGTQDTTTQLALVSTSLRAASTDNIVMFPPVIEIIRAQ